MGKSFYWLCKNQEVTIVENWIQINGGKLIEMSPLTNNYIIHFEKLGPLEFIKKESLELNENHTWREKKEIILQQMHFEKYHDISLIDKDRSPVALYVKPVLKDSMFWTSGELNFLPSNLKETWPELSRICSSFERWISKEEKIFDNTKKSIINDFGYYIGGRMGSVRKIFAFPDALEGLRKGEYFLDNNISDLNYEEWLKILRLRGVCISDLA